MTPIIESLSKRPFAECSLVAARNAEFPRHTHEEYVISANLCGRERIWYDGRSQEVLPGQVTLYNPMTVQSSRFCSAGARFISVHLDAAYVASVFGTAQGPLFDEGAFIDGALFKVIAALHAANDDSRREEAPYELLAELSRFRDQGNVIVELDRVSQVVEFMLDNLYEDIDLQDISAMAGLSKFHLVRSFKTVKSLAPMQFLKQLRLIEVRKRLRRGDAAARVATELYFYDQGHMCNSFRRVMGISPNRYASMFNNGLRTDELHIA
ncbi:transcriptional regulator [Pseudomonas cichorii]|uniref:helix-turn-helix transcriptional regulator n=1 Tax=Pseudomonas capsici TaxID=2810614 RepID=UPI000E3DC40F|nr:MULTISPECIES: AraC family transcriptional regulator [Pseudomonas]MCV4283632.1 AraC family transcriptional regulator [Pseudomonas capsici]GFM52756.1 transcriptional regulator [Pseudomonas cichorii]